MKAVIFVGGTSYSGSTMLDLMLSSGDGCFSLGEVVALFRPYRPHHFDAHCGCGDHECSIWPSARRTGAGRLYQTVFERYPTVDTLVDSSKDPLWIFEQARRLTRQGVRVEHVLIWKTPTEFAASKVKRGEMHNIRREWVRYHRLYASLFERYVCVEYADLARAPALTLKTLSRSLGLEYFAGKEEYWNFKHHTLFGNNSAKDHLRDLSIRESSQDARPHRAITYQPAAPREDADSFGASGHRDAETSSIQTFLETASCVTPFEAPMIGHTERQQALRESVRLTGPRLLLHLGPLALRHVSGLLRARVSEL